MPLTIMRHCRFCDRELKVEATRPGWTVVRVGGITKWACPDCMRDGAGFLDDGPRKAHDPS